MQRLFGCKGLSTPASSAPLPIPQVEVARHHVSAQEPTGPDISVRTCKTYNELHKVWMLIHFKLND